MSSFHHSQKLNSPKRNQHKLSVEERREQVAKMMRARIPQRRIALQLEVDPATVSRDVQAILESLKEEQKGNIETWRALELDGLAALQERMMELLESDDTEITFKATDRLIKIIQKRCRLLGLDFSLQPVIAHSFEFGSQPDNRKSEAMEQLFAKLRQCRESLTKDNRPEPGENASEMEKIAYHGRNEEEWTVLLRHALDREYIKQNPHLDY